MKRLLVAALLAYSQVSYGSVEIAVGYSSQIPVVRLQVLADYVVVPVTISNDSNDPLRRLDEIEKTLQMLIERVNGTEGLSLRRAGGSLAPGGAGSSGASYEAEGPSERLYVFGSLKREPNVFVITRRIHEAMATLQTGVGTRITLGNSMLGVENPDRYRDQLLQMIGHWIAQTKKTLNLADSSVDIGGLEDSVTVMQLNEREVFVFIDYKLHIRTKSA